MNTCPNSIVEAASGGIKIELINSEKFATGSGNALFQLNTSQTGKLSIYTINGQLINEIAFTGNAVELAPNLLQSGIYIANLSTLNGMQSFKLVRL